NSKTKKRQSKAHASDNVVEPQNRRRSSRSKEEHKSDSLATISTNPEPAVPRSKRRGLNCVDSLQTLFASPSKAEAAVIVSHSQEQHEVPQPQEKATQRSKVKAEKS